MSEMEKIREAARYIREKTGTTPEFAIILGSGLGELADQLLNVSSVDFAEIPHFPRSTVEGHRGRLVVGEMGTVRVMVLQGRFHYYEGYTMAQVVFPLRCMLLSGVKNLVVTNAAGSANPEIRPGELMLIKDHINLSGESPLRGANFEEFGPRFNDMSEPYSGEIRTLAHRCAGELGMALKEGVYFYMPGPSYETASEIRAISILGGDVAGMSTVPEVLVAAHGGMKILGISCITNMGTGIDREAIGHEEVIRTGRQVSRRFISLLFLVLTRWSAK